MAQHDSHVDIYVNVHDEQAERDIRRLEGAVERAAAKIDREEADFKIGVRHDKLKKDLEQVDRDIEGFQKKLDGKLNDRARKRTEILMREARAERSKIQDTIKGIEGSIKSRKDEAKAIDFTTKRLELLNKAEEKREKILAAADRRRRSAEATAAREQSRRERELASVPKLDRAYNQLIDKLEKLQRVKKKAMGDERSVFMVELEENDIVERMENIRSQVNRIAQRDPIVMEITPRFSERAGTRVRYEFMRNQGSLMPIAAAIGADVGARMGASARRSFSNTMEKGMGATLANVGRNLSQSAGRGAVGALGRLGGALQGLSSASVRLGPFTTSIRGAVVGLSVLAPILVDVVGALGSLVSVAGSAALGIGALGAGAIGGALPALLGFGLVIKDVAQEFADVKKAQKAYDDAVKKGNTDLAKKKLKELRAVMGNVSEETAKNVASAQKLGDAWDKATQPSRASVWNTIGDAIKTGNVLVDDFAERTNTGMGIAEKATRAWMKAIRSSEGRATLGTMMDNFNKSLGPVLNGMGDLVGYFAKVGAVASGELPGLARTFERWAQGLNDSADGSAEFQDKIREVIQSAKDVGNFFMAAGRLVKSFFGGGVDAGQSFTRTMTDAMNRWTNFLNTAQGQNQLGEFFTEAVRGAQSLYSFLAPIVSGFVSWARSISPIARGFFEGASAVSKFVAELGRLANVGGWITGLVTTLGALWAVGRISSAARAVQGFSAALLGLSRAQAAVTATSAAGGVAGAVAGARGAAAAGSAAKAAQTASAASNVAAAAGGAAAARAAGNVGKMARAGNAAKTALSGLGGMALGISSPIAGLGVVALAAAGGMYVWANRTKDWDKSTSRAQKNFDVFSMGMAQIGPGYAQLAQQTLQAEQATLDLSQAQKQSAAEERQLNKLREDGKKGTQEYRNLQEQHKQTILGLRSARLNDIQAQQQQRQQYDAIKKVTKETVQAASEEVEQRRKSVKELGSNKLAEHYKVVEENARKAGQSVKEYLKENGSQAFPVDRLLKYGAAMNALEHSQGRLTHAQRVAALESVNLDRAMAGLLPVASKAAKAFAEVAKLGGAKLQKKISLKFEDPGQASRVAASTAKALRAGVPSTVTSRIVTNSKDAEDAIRRLRNIRIPEKRMRIIEEGGKPALEMLGDLVGKKLAPKVLRIMGEKRDAQSKYDALVALGIPPKVARMLGDNRDAKQKAAEANAQKLNNLFQSIIRKIQNPPGLFGKIADAFQYVKRIITGGKKASGKRAGEPGEVAVVGEGSRWQGAKEYVVDRVTGGVTAVKGAQFMALGRNDAVIPTESKHKAKGRSIFREVARDLGLERYAGGKRGKALSSAGRVKAGNEARSKVKKKVPKKVRYSTENLTELKTVEMMKRKEDNLREKVQREASQVDAQEPSTFLRKTGQDEDGNPTYDINLQAIQAWEGKLNTIAGRFAELVTAVQNTLTAVEATMRKLAGSVNADPFGGKVQGGIIGKADKNIEVLKKLISGESGTVKDPKKSKASRQAAAERLRVYNGALGEEEGARRAALSDWKEMDTEKNDIGDKTRGRMADALDSQAQYREDAKGVMSVAQEQNVSAAPDPKKPEAPPEPPTPLESAQTALSGIEASDAMAKAGLPGGVAATDAALIGANNNIISAAQGMLTDGDPSNDSTAYSAITSAAQAITGINQGATDAAAAASAQSQGLGTARQSMFGSFGSNFAMAGSIGAVNSRFGSGAYGLNVGGGAGAAPAAAGGVHIGQIVVPTTTVTDDPHTLSKSIGWELQAAL